MRRRIRERKVNGVIPPAQSSASQQKAKGDDYERPQSPECVGCAPSVPDIFEAARQAVHLATHPQGTAALPHDWRLSRQFVIGFQI